MFYLKPKNIPDDYIPQESLEDIPFGKTTRNKLVGGSSTSILYRPGWDSRRGHSTGRLTNYNVEDRSPSNRGHLAVQTYQNPGESNCHNEQPEPQRATEMCNRMQSPSGQTDEQSEGYYSFWTIKINQAGFISNVSNKKSGSLTNFSGMHKFSYVEPMDWERGKGLQHPLTPQPSKHRNDCPRSFPKGTYGYLLR